MQTCLISKAIDDPTGEIAAAYTQKYLGYADMGDFTSMTAGMTDVCSSS